ncbi:hypothetical protein HDU84_000017 [Entophlyctis sp. JEL0112]|nr:hypothetical protein HDU84_000017 [Entophlyctis sp. JEL0112]
MTDRQWRAADNAHLSDNLRCPICTDVFANPRRLAKCGHYFCRECLAHWMSQSQSCPIDRIPILAASDVTRADRLVLAMIDDVAVDCEFCGYRGVKTSHCCPLFACHEGSCGFMGSEEDALGRHQELAHGAADSASSSRKYEQAQHQLLLEEDEETSWLPKSDSLLAGAVVVAASVIGGVILGRRLAAASRREAGERQ